VRLRVGVKVCFVITCDEFVGVHSSTYKKAVRCYEKRNQGG
jgi:hypothetical protein